MLLVYFLLDDVEDLSLGRMALLCVLRKGCGGKGRCGVWVSDWVDFCVYSLRFGSSLVERRKGHDMKRGIDCYLVLFRPLMELLYFLRCYSCLLIAWLGQAIHTVNGTILVC